MLWKTKKIKDSYNIIVYRGFIYTKLDYLLSALLQSFSWDDSWFDLKLNTYA